MYPGIPEPVSELLKLRFLRPCAEEILCDGIASRPRVLVGVVEEENAEVTDCGRFLSESVWSEESECSQSCEWDGD